MTQFGHARSPAESSQFPTKRELAVEWLPRYTAQPGRAGHVHAKVRCQTFPSFFDPDFAVIVIPCGDGIIAEQKTAADDAIQDMNDGNFVWIENFRMGQPSRPSPPHRFLDGFQNGEGKHSEY